MTVDGFAPRAVVMVSNGISAAMAKGALERDGYALADVALVRMRQFDLDWADACGRVIDYGRAPSLTLQGQWAFIPFYRQTTRELKRWLASGRIRDIYIANIDNLLTNHVVRLAQAGRLPGSPRISVVAEGFMNYQEIGLKDRASWRWLVKPTIAVLLGLRYRRPQTHLSGSFEPGIERVFSYSGQGLKAPPERFVEIRFPTVTPAVPAEPRTALVVLTGIGQWMTAEAFDRFRLAFVAFVDGLGFERVLVKPHPFYDCGGIEKMLARAEVVTDRRRLEEMAAELPSATVIGYCSTALVVLKLMRPDLRILDWGSDYYCEHAYHGDRSIVDVLRSAEVEIVEMNAA